MIDIEQIKKYIEPSIIDMGYSLVRVMISKGSRPTLQVMIERTDRRPMTVAHCSKVSRRLSALLDDEEIMSTSYILEVSTPGLNRPLITLEDFQRFIDQEARIQTHQPINGRRRYQGVLKGLTENNQVIIAIARENYHIPFDQIHGAHLVVPKLFPLPKKC